MMMASRRARTSSRMVSYHSGIGFLPDFFPDFFSERSPESPEAVAASSTFVTHRA